MTEIERPIFRENTLSRKTGSWRDAELKQKPRYLQETETISLCMISCPIHQDIRGWLASLKDKNPKTAMRKLLLQNPLPASVSRVCPAFCEKGCAFLRKDFDTPVAISQTEKFLGDLAIKSKFHIDFPAVAKDKKVAIVGSGPAGLTCAYSLRLKGYFVTVFEKESKLGGLLRYGIPEDRLPKEILDRELILHFQGIDFRLDTEITENNFKEIEKEFSAIFLAPGFTFGKTLDIPGVRQAGVITAIDFLKKATYGDIAPLVDKTVFIVGAGNTAMDCSRVALQLGAKASIFYRGDKAKASQQEIEKTRQAGAEFRPLALPVKISENTPRLTVEFQSPISNFTDECDLLIFAVGQEKSPFWEKIVKGQKPYLFTGGDFLLGPKTVAQAINSGKESARKIINFLNGKPHLRAKPKIRINRDSINFAYFEPQPRKIDLKKEVKRCFSCGLCRECENCFNFCPEPAVKKTGNAKKPYIVDYDYCKGCGICAKECPRGVIVMEEENEGE
ncbi:MAG: FAD-dependent oxidoreductase [Candidatus Nealsonbacteria bacterium]|nr:FAD-dependent oxidoreductase [Candidatus Nealsonbacteria bacterium]